MNTIQLVLDDTLTVTSILIEPPLCMK